mmetsp:Transcript_26574/g.49611  ORF Transcript_26574/g.49611 Transcript_26574/m.49611 type:complete len:133 (-) Transcript_26574:43-441(-)
MMLPKFQMVGLSRGDYYYYYYTTRGRRRLDCVFGLLDNVEETRHKTLDKKRKTRVHGRESGLPKRRGSRNFRMSGVVVRVIGVAWHWFLRREENARVGPASRRTHFSEPEKPDHGQTAMIQQSSFSAFLLVN